MEKKKKTLLKDLTVTSVDLCNRGANPEAHFMLKKSTEALKGGEKMNIGVFANVANTVKKIFGVNASTEEVQTIINATQKSTIEKERENMIFALQKSISSIMKDDTLDDEEKEEELAYSFDEFSISLEKAIKQWKEDELEEEDSEEDLEEELETNDAESEKTTKKEDTEMFDTEKMSPEDKEIYFALAEKYGEHTKEKTKELHPEVKKALEEAQSTRNELEELKKSLEISKLETIAKKYEIIGKKPDELAAKLYELQKSDAYNDYIAMLDEMVSMTENTGIFKEYGSNRTGSGTVDAKMSAAVSEIMKTDTSLTYSQAVVKACDNDSELKTAFEGR